MPQGVSWFNRFLREDNSEQDPFPNNLNINNPSYPYAALLKAWLVAAGAPSVYSLFQASMSVTQTVSHNTTARLVLNSAAVNAGGNYNTSTQRWTPPAGTVAIRANGLLIASKSTESYGLLIAKNGITFPVPLAQDVFKVAGSFMVAATSVFDLSNGTDFYELYISNPSPNVTDIVVNNNAANTGWSGTQWPGP